MSKTPAIKVAQPMAGKARDLSATGEEAEVRTAEVRLKQHCSTSDCR
jgi:hypothetical protein